VVAYGETARHIADHLERVFREADTVAELIVPIMLHPLELEPVEQSVRQTGALLVVEDGSTDFGIGAEIIARLTERGLTFRAQRLGAAPVPVPAVVALENVLLPAINKLLSTLGQR
jgi:pyruvate/2-oxoglutarate/acetoin dehydrogenase E1 component